jgi:hypothetical protein
MDDVDIEFDLTRDPHDHARMTLTPRKSRLPGIGVVHLTLAEDDQSRCMRYVGSGDPAAERAEEVLTTLDALKLPIEAGESRALEVLKKAGFHFVRSD